MTLHKRIKDRVIHGYTTISIEDVRETDMLSTSAEDNPSVRDGRWKNSITVEIETYDIWIFYHISEQLKS